MTLDRALLAIAAPLLLMGAVSCATPGPPGASDSAAETSEDALMAQGRTVFLELSDPKCGVCHLLGEAGTSGMIGPDLDELRPDVGRVVAAVSGGVGVMSAQDHLTEDQIRAVAHYVASSTRGLD